MLPVYRGMEQSRLWLFAANWDIGSVERWQFGVFSQQAEYEVVMFHGGVGWCLGVELCARE